MDALADLHARFWRDPRLGIDLGQKLTPERAQAQTERLQGTLPDLFDFLGDALLPWQRATYDKITSSSYLKNAFGRLVNAEGLTLIHGDAHSANVMFPRDPARHRVMLIDWQHWDLGVGTQDLAFLMALHWSSRRRALLERTLLERYHTRLLQQGVTDYPWPDFFDDYRRSDHHGAHPNRPVPEADDQRHRVVWSAKCDGGLRGFDL